MGVFADSENYARDRMDGGIIASINQKSTGKNKGEVNIRV